MSHPHCPITSRQIGHSRNLGAVVTEPPLGSMIKTKEGCRYKQISSTSTHDQFSPDWWKRLLLPLIAVGWGGMALFCTMENHSRVGRVGFTVGALVLIIVSIWQRWISTQHLKKYLPPLIAIYVSLILSCLFSLSYNYSFDTFFKQHFWFGFIFLAVGCWAVTEKRQKAFLWGITIAGLYASIAGIILFYFASPLEHWGLIEKVSDYVYISRDEAGNQYFRARGLMLSYTRSALILVFALPATLILLIRSHEKNKSIQQLLLIGALCIGGWYLILTGARGAWVATMIATLSCTFFLRINWRAVLVGIMVCGAVFLASTTPRERLLTFINDLSNPEQLLSGRPSLWKLAQAPITDHRWTGVGYGGNIFLTDEVLEQYPLYSAGTKQPDLHSLYLQTLAEVGIFGFAAYFCFTAALFLLAGRQIWLHRKKHPPSGGIFALSVFLGMLTIGIVYNINEGMIAQLLAATLGLLPASAALLSNTPESDIPLHADRT